MIKKLLNWLFSKGEEEKPVSEEPWRVYLREEKIAHNRDLISVLQKRENPDYEQIDYLEKEIKVWEEEIRSGKFKGYY